jgi:hypothetical protein
MTLTAQPLPLSPVATGKAPRLVSFENSNAIYSDGSFKVAEGTLAFAPGSSGWPGPMGGTPLRWMELFLRGGSAWERFGRPRINQLITRIS